MIPKRILLAWLENLAFPVSCLAILTGLIVLANAIWYFVGGPQNPETAVEFAEPTYSNDSISNVETITSAHLFGIAGSVEPQQEVIQNTNLRLQLHGTVVSQDPEKSVALISTQSQRQPKIFRINGTVAGIARLEEIQSHRVILSRGGKKEQLLYSNNDPLIKHTNLDNTDKIRKNSDSTGAYIEQSTLTESEFENMIAEHEISIDENVEYLEYGVDFDLDSGNKYGLKKGDKILSLNDIPVQEFASQSTKSLSLGESNQLKIEIQRDNRRFSIEISPEQ